MLKNSSNSEGGMPNKDLLTDEDLMKLFGVSKSSIGRWRNKQYLPCFKMGSKHFYPKNILKKMIKESVYKNYEVKKNPPE